MDSSLLFFDTFTHEANDALQLDLVQFRHAVQVTEIRIIPLGARVQADFPGGVRLGATNPSQIDVEFFVNDLTKRGAATFESIGTFKYEQHSAIQLEFVKKTATDGLLLRGKYTTITLAVYGKATKVPRDPSPKPPTRSEPIAPPPEKINAHERIRDWLEGTKTSKTWKGEKDGRKRYCRDSEGVRSRSPEGSVERSDKESTHRSSRGPYSREKSFDRDESVGKRRRKRSKDDDGDRKANVRDSYEGESITWRARRKADDWEDHVSERSGLSGRRPRTPPLEPLASPFEYTSPLRKKDARDWDRTSDRESDWERQDASREFDYRSLEGSVKDWYGSKEKGKSTENETPKSAVQALPITAILSEEMEAISDDELDIPATMDPIEEDSFEQIPDEGDGFEYEDIMSDEEDLAMYCYEDDYIVDEWEGYVQQIGFNELVSPSPATHMPAPYLSPYEINQIEHNTNDSFDSEQVDKLMWLINDTKMPTLPDTDSDAVIPSDSGEPWIQALEQVAQMLPSNIGLMQNKNELLDKLYEWLDLAVDYRAAIKEEQPVFKIRHMKGGVRLASSLIQCAPLTTDRLEQMDIADKLIKMLNQPYMALSIKLLIIRTIDDLARIQGGLSYLVKSKPNGQPSAYESILQQLTVSQSCRSKVALSAVVRKIHLMEICEKLQQDADSVKQSTHHDETNDGCPGRISLAILSSIDSCLREILFHYDYCPQLFVQSTNLLPGSKQFQLPKTNYDGYPHLYRIFQETHLIQSLASLTCNESDMRNNTSVMKLVCDLVMKLLSTEHGLRFLTHSSPSLHSLMRNFILNDVRIEEETFEGRLRHLGYKIGYCIQLVSALDWLMVLAKSTDCHYSEECVQLNILQSISLQSVGKEAIISVLGHFEFCKILFPYLQPVDIEKNGPKAACYGYAVDLVTNAVKFSDNISLIRDASHHLVPLMSADGEELKNEDVTKFASVLPFVSFVKAEMFCHDNIAQLTTLVQENLDKLDKCPGELLTCLRILKHLSIPSVSVPDRYAEEVIEELKYQYAIARLFSEDFHTCLLNLLSKICSLYQQPLLYASNFVTSEGLMIVSLLTPTLLILKKLLSSVIESRNADFHDLTAIQQLVNTYILLDSFGAQSVAYYQAKRLQQMIIETLLSYTQPTYSTEGEEVLSKSLWTQMMAEIFKSILVSPHTMSGVMTIVTKLLPLNLPMYTTIPLTPNQAHQAVLARKLWSAHLYSLAPIIHETIQCLGIGTHPSLTHSLRKMCVSLSDLSAPMAFLIARALIDLLLTTHKLDHKSHTNEFMPSTAQTYRVIGMAASLMSHPPTRVAFISLIMGASAPLALPASKFEDKYLTLVSIWSSILCSPDQSSLHTQTKISILLCLCNLLDAEKCMDPIDKVVPPKEITGPLLDAVVEVLRSSTIQLSHLALQVLYIVLTIDSGFVYVKCALDKKKSALRRIFVLLSRDWEKDVDNHLVILRDLLDFCATLVHSNDGHGAATPYELSLYLGWNLSTDKVNKTELDDDKEEKFEEGDINLEECVDLSHPLMCLEKIVTLPYEDEEDEMIYSDLLHLIQLLAKVSTSPRDTTNLDVVSSVQECVQTAFTKRLVCLPWYPDADDPMDWLNPPICDHFPEEEMVRVNLMDMCGKYTESFDLVATLNKLAKGQISQSLSPQKASKVLPKYKASASAIRSDKKGRPYVAPMRGRNFARGINIRSDPFRSRPPNTSRPPSLHVDDFVALESTGQQPTGPTGYNKISFGRGKMMLDSMRGRGGRGRGESSSRGRYFHRSAYRGDARGMRGRGLRSSWSFRDSSRGNYRGSSGNFLRGRASPYLRSSSSKERFQGKFVDRGRRDSGQRANRNFH